MKKTAIAALLAGSIAAAPAMALDVGDRMPDPTQGTYISEQGRWGNARHPAYLKEGLYAFHSDPETCEDRWTSAYLSCNGDLQAKPFGIYDFKEGKLYLDLDLDGVIDRLGDRTERIYDSAPNCLEPM